jgi:hypothetical protein
MDKLLRTLLVAAAATGVAALALSARKRRPAPLPAIQPPSEIEADDLSPAQRQQLMDELADHL